MRQKLPLVLIAFIIITACLTPQLQEATSTPPVPLIPITATPASNPTSALTVCLGQEPNTL